MPVGGFNGTDPSPAPDAFLRLALSKRIHYFIVTNPVHEDQWGHLDTNALIQQWVQRNFTPDPRRQGDDLRPDDVAQASIAAISSTDQGGLSL